MIITKITNEHIYCNENKYSIFSWIEKYKPYVGLEVVFFNDALYVEHNLDLTDIDIKNSYHIDGNLKNIILKKN